MHADREDACHVHFLTEIHLFMCGPELKTKASKGTRADAHFKGCSIQRYVSWRVH